MHTEQLRRETTSEEFPWSLQNLSWSKHCFCFALFSSLQLPPCWLKARNLLSSRASSAGRNQHWSHCERHKGAEITSKQQETAKLYETVLQHHCLWHNETDLQAREGRKPACNQQERLLYVVSWYGPSYISEQLQKQKTAPWLSVVYRFSVADVKDKTSY